MHRTVDLNIAACRRLPTPGELRELLPRSDALAAFVDDARAAIRRILRGEDRRLLAIVGPCSIHDMQAGLEFAGRCAELAREVEDRIVVVMRAYFEKPRTAGGWAGLIMDPYLDGSGEIAHGLRSARRFLREVLELGVPTATEFLDPISPQYLADLVCWAALGARTSESQAHRQLASGLSMPVGCKNGTSGSIMGAVNAIKTGAQPQTFFGVDVDGRAAAIHTRGNRDCHLVLRGGASGPNYAAPHVVAAEAELRRAGAPRAIIIDCSHDNSGRRPERQLVVAREVVAQVRAGNRAIAGLMLESNLLAGNQPLVAGARLRPGVSITDACLDWDSTEACLREAHAALADRGAAPDSRNSCAAERSMAG